jgi:phage tail protein X
MADTYRTSDGDTVDAIAWRYYNSGAAAYVGAILGANPGLAALGPVLPMGLEIVLPVVAAPAAKKQGVKLWD